MTLNQLTELFSAIYTLASLLGHILPSSWACTKILNRFALNLKK